ncbi:MAG: sulfite exporter TauE/SafE family protein [Actinomycetota bacterium]|nr:sulfite exporter TauE/SafE family protein [Actinomycetota bacterium]
MSALDITILVLGGLAAGTINSIAGGGSLLTVPLLVVAGVPGNVANGSNRVGVLASNASAVLAFRRLGVDAFRNAGRILGPVVAGSIIGALTIGQLDDAAFERVFGFLMVPILLISLRKPKPRTDGEAWSQAVTFVVFFAIGIYGGAFQAGIGLILIVALSHSGMDLVTANAVKVLVNVVVTLAALPVFIANGQIDWGPALVLAVGFTAGGALGARLTVKGGERLVRPVMIAAVLVLAGELIGLY